MIRTRVFLLLLLLFAAGVFAGCTTAHNAVVRAHRGCDARIGPPGMRTACHACVDRGPRWAYYPERAPGHRCVRR